MDESSNNFKPMILERLSDPDTVRYPTLCTPKVTGVRCLTLEDGEPKDETLNPIPNKHISQSIKEYNVPFLDGTIHIPGLNYAEMVEAVMEPEGKPKFEYYLYDLFTPKYRGTPYRVRVEELQEIPKPRPNFIKILKPTTVYDAEGFMDYWDHCANKRYEGVISRRPGGVYICGTSVHNVACEYTMFETGVAKIIGFVEGEPKTLKAWKCQDLDTKIKFTIDEGFTSMQRHLFWRNRQVHVGDEILYTHQPNRNGGPPRFPVFLRLR